MSDITQPQLIEELRRIAKEAIDLGAKMEFYGGVNDFIARRGRHLVNAGAEMLNWADQLDVTKYDDDTEQDEGK